MNGCGHEFDYLIKLFYNNIMNSSESTNTGPLLTRRQAMGMAAVGAAGVLAGVGIDEGIRLYCGRVRPYTQADVEKHIQDSRKVWHLAGHILENGSTECLDGRGDQCEIGRAAGDMGDLIEKIAAFERATNTEFSEIALDRIWEHYMRRHRGQFYMHTDDDAIHALSNDLKVPEAEVLTLLTEAHGNNERLLQTLTDPRFIGCGHLARMLRFPREYPGVRSAVVQFFMKKFFREKWGGNPKMQYAVLHGKHREGAVVNVQANREFNAQTPVPLIQPNVQRSGSQVFLLNKQMDDLAQDRWLENALEITGLSEFHAQRCRQTMLETRNTHLQATADALAHGLPVFDVFYNPGALNQFEVKPAV